MKIVKNYKGLKKWAKTSFVALLTICIIFTTTGVGSLIAYAEPHVHVFAGTPQYNGDGTHIVTCSICGETFSEPCSTPPGYVYDQGNATQHYRTCTGCARHEAEDHSFDANGDCACGYHQEQTPNNTEPDNSRNPDNTNNSNNGGDPNTGNPDNTTNPDNSGDPANTNNTNNTSQSGNQQTDTTQTRGENNENVNAPILRSPPPSGQGGTSSYNNPLSIAYSSIAENIRFGAEGASLSQFTDEPAPYYTGNVTVRGEDGWNFAFSASSSGNQMTLNYGTDTTANPVHLIYAHSFEGNNTTHYLVYLPAISFVSPTTTPTGTLQVGTVSSTGNSASSSVVGRIGDPVSIAITGNGPSPVGIQSIHYYISSDYIASPETITAWTLYNDSSRPTTAAFAGREFYVYAKITNDIGNVSYLSAGKIGFTPSDNTGSSTGKIIIDSYSSDRVAGTENTVYSTSVPKSIEIQASNSSSGVSNIEYAISEEAFLSTSDIVGAVVDGKLKWKPYSDSSRPTTPSNKSVYVYARITDNDGKYNYISTGKIEFAMKNGTSEGAIIVDTYSSKELTKNDELVYLTQDPKEIQITAANNNSGVSVTNIEYATSEEKYYTVSDIVGAVVDGKMKWKTYFDSSRPTLPENKATYIYARITNSAGEYTYLSTGKLIYDTKAPTVNTITLAEGNDGMMALLTGKDNLSGIYRFYLRYVEKGDKNTTPTALEVIKDNWYTEELTADELSAGGKFKMPSDLDPKKTYIFYGVAIDKAGNISEVKVYETKGKASKDSSASKNSVDNPAGGSGSDGAGGAGGNGSGGLAAAPNGIAGSGGGNPNPSSATSNWADQTQSTGSTDPLDREINRVPYIADATGDTKIGLAATGGWDKIEDEVTNAQNGTRMSVDMSGLSVIPGSMIRTLQNKDVSVTLKMADDIEWIINGADVDMALGSDIDLRTIRDAKVIPDKLLNDIIGAYPHTEIDIAHDGDFGFTATLRVPFGESSAGMYGNLYYYDEEAGELKLIQSALIGNDGYAAFRMSHASDYSVVVKSVDMAAALSEPGTTEVSTIDDTVDISDARAELSLLPQTGRSILGMRIWLFVMALICAAMCLAILFIPSFQREKVYN